MKYHFHLLLACLAILIGFTDSVHAQKQLQDSLWAFNEPLKLISEDRDLMDYQKMSFKPLTPDGLVLAPHKLTQAFSVPRSARMGVKPLLVSSYTSDKSESCWLYTCHYQCKECYLFWYDRNRDNLVQPLSELRCVTRQGKSRGISLQRVECE